ncbi:aspartate aminotransferase family protein [Natranaerofaba carboxydovora]|uniref:aspartate aminotransferase family protein n=1 Tax=Natranaerofaba carboxydovora TaxID=2742683 RepID=UPI001F1480C8|nr:aspartate aminotransferase family protein [Natranaerofaba carboxydovora]UMZ75306.1 Aminotransferase PigE [Natranaerofaba carboxydovora]
MFFILVSLEQALSQTEKEIKKRHEEYLNPGFARMLSLLSFDKKFDRAHGTYIWDKKGNKYLDFLGGYGSLNLGHNPQNVINAIKKVEQVPNILQASLNPFSGVLGENLAKITPGDLKHTFLCNSGAEAVEGALKLARKSTGKNKIVYCEGSFHGKTYGSLSVSGREKYKKGFGSLLPGCIEIPYGNLEELKKALEEDSEDIAAFILEPIKGEGGIITPPEGYLREVRQLCDKFEVLMICDEIQTGLARTGEMFACDHEKVTPDILCMAKSLGGGVMPIGAFITTEKLWKKAYGKFEEALLHTSTFGGNTRASVAAIATLEEIYQKDLCSKAKEKGEYMSNKMLELKDKHPLIKEVRGKGLMVGIEFKTIESKVLNKLSGGAAGKLSEEYTGALIAEMLQNEFRVITAYTLNNPNVIRFEPPLTVSTEDIDVVADALDVILKKNSSFVNLAANSSKKFIGNIIKKSR